jgi:hypothetical protein
VVRPFLIAQKKEQAMEMQYEISLLVAFAIGAEPLRCWRNAALAVLEFPNLTYVEGWIVIPGKESIKVVEHGWCTSPTFGIIDPSLVLLEEQEPASYFPGFEIDGHEFLLRMLRSTPDGRVLPLMCHAQYGEDGMGHEGYKQAYDKAWQRAREVAQERQLPSSAINVSTRSGQLGYTVVIEGLSAPAKTSRQRKKRKKGKKRQG